MESWLSKDFVVEFISKTPKDYRKPIVIEPKFSEKPSRPSRSFVDIDLYKSLNSTKDHIEGSSEWEKWSRLTNPYEKIIKIARSSSTISEEKRSNMTVSRAYFKLCEILQYYIDELIVTSEPIKSAHFCEAPGGFIKALMKMRPNADWYAQTLYEGTDSLKVDPIVNIPERWVRNGDKTGNLYHLENIQDFPKVSGKVNLVTADGGFDVSFDPNNQEQLSLQLIYSEVVAALHCQEIGGMFVCKIFDSVTKPTCQLIYLMTDYYDHVYLMKPRTSRYSNSEKYIVATKFKGISSEDLEALDSVITKWSESAGDHLPFCRDFGFEHPESFKKTMHSHNISIIKNQIKYINNSLSGSQHGPTHARSLEAFQNKRAMEFCEAFELGTYNKLPHICKHFKTRHVGSGVKKCEKCLKLLI
jgi:23S rRNA U2552 (ribose-2'-O)-methylase RlmE/FtsJ